MGAYPCYAERMRDAQAAMRPSVAWAARRGPTTQFRAVSAMPRPDRPLLTRGQAASYRAEQT